MFELTGTVKGTTYNQEPMSADQLIDLFDLEIDWNGKKKLMQFELHSSQKKYDRWNKLVAFQHAKMLRSLITGVHHGNSVNIQYYRRKTVKRENGVNVPSYTPHHLEYAGNDLAFVLDQAESTADKELMVFFMLSTKCADSPIQGQYPEKYFQINDTVAKAEKEVAEYTRMYEVQSVIMNPEADIHLLRTKAAGMGISESTMEDVEVRAALMNRARADIESFWKQYDSVKTSFRGMLTRAIDMGIIIEKSKGAGVFAYGFNADISQRDHGNQFQELATFVVGQNGRSELERAVSANAGLVDEINMHIQSVGTEKDILEGLKEDQFRSASKAKAAVKDAKSDPYEESAAWAMKNNMILIDDKTGKASYRHSTRKTIELGDVNVDDDLEPQIAFLLSSDEGKSAHESIIEKMKQ